MKSSDYIADYLHHRGVTHVFEVIGGMITHMIDSLHKRGQIKIVSVHHEQAAAFAVDGIARMTGIPGVAMATSGPGATNLLTGIGSCYFDSSPAVFITGQVNRSEQKGSRSIRQLGFQETDIATMAAPITKGSWRVNSLEKLPTMLHNAFELAMAGRPGPVLLDIPMDVQRMNITAEMPAASDVPIEQIDRATFEDLLRGIRRAERPLILAGGGVRSALAADLFRVLVEQVKVPVVNSLMAVDLLPAGHPLRVGLIGSYGNRWANLTIGRSDFLMVMGSRLDVRQTGSETAAFKGDRTIYHIDCEPGEVNNRVVGCRPIHSHLRSFLARLLDAWSSESFTGQTEWLAEIDELRKRWPDIAENKDVAGINPNLLMREISAVSPQAACYVVDVGQHQMWAAQSLQLGPTQRFLTSGGMGAMGFALPAAVGASMAVPGKTIVIIAGDGGFQLNIQELQTVVRNRLPLKIVIVNNRCHGMVRQFQQSYFDGRYQSTFWGYSAPDFARVAQAYGISAAMVDKPADLQSALERMWRQTDEPYLLEIGVDTFANALPKIAFGRPVTEMEPFAKPIEMEGT